MNPQDAYISQIMQNDLEASMKTYEYLTNPNRGNHITMEELQHQLLTGNGAWVLKTYDIIIYQNMINDLKTIMGSWIDY